MFFSKSKKDIEYLYNKLKNIEIENRELLEIAKKSLEVVGNLEKENVKLSKRLEILEVNNAINEMANNFLDENVNSNNELNTKINKLEKQIYILKEENNFFKTIHNLDMFYKTIFFDINNNKYISALKKLNDFYEINKLWKNGISNKYINNYINGKKGEIEVLNQFSNLTKNNIIEYFYDFNLKNEEQNMQFDFLAITRNNIYIIDVKNINTQNISISKNTNKYYIKLEYNNEFYNINFDKIEKRYKLVDNIVRKFKVKHNDIKFNIFNILVFINNKTILLEEDFKDIIFKEYHTNIPLSNGIFVQTILGKENLSNYFERHTFKFTKEETIYEDKKILDEFMKFIKSDITFVESTDKKYIIKDVQNIFSEIYKLIENKKLDLKFK